MGDWELLLNDATFQATLSNTDGTVITADCAPGPDGFVEATAHYGSQKVVKTTECTNLEWGQGTMMLPRSISTRSPHRRCLAQQSWFTAGAIAQL